MIYFTQVRRFHFNNSTLHIVCTQFLTTIWYLGVIGKDFTFPSSMRFAFLMCAFCDKYWSVLIIIRFFDLVQCYINSLLSAFFGFLLVHTCVFHGYMNFVSELLRFADREFYQVRIIIIHYYCVKNCYLTVYAKDWWTSTTFSSYYRKWNIIVYDWIYSYLYADMKSVSLWNMIWSVWYDLLWNPGISESFSGCVCFYFCVSICSRISISFSTEICITSVAVGICRSWW